MTKDAVFNQDMVRQLATILQETDLTEIEYEVDGCRVKVARQVTVAQTVSVPHGAIAAPAPMAAPAAAPVAIDPAAHPGAIKSPMVGNVYLSPSPDAAPFIKVGDRVNKGQNLLIIEAMKVMNPIKSDKEGTVKEILVTNGMPVEFDQVLLIIE
jgi:acetyl-CoA carboxylase biotin carboxyl carrier protein